MRMTLRDFFTNARRVHQLNDDGDLLDKMSPLLQGTVALAANRKWLEQVWFFRGVARLDCGSDFIAALAKSLVIRSYVGHERLPIGQLYVLRCGVVVKMWRFLGSGKVRCTDDLAAATRRALTLARRAARVVVAGVG